MSAPMGGDSVRQCIAKYQASILRLAFAYLRSTQDAEDVAQEVFLSYYRRDVQFLNCEHEKAWLLRVTVNRCKNQLKNPWRQRRAPMPENLPGIQQAESELLLQVLSLPNKYRLPIHLFYYEGYSIKEIADILSEKQATIGTHLARGRELLRGQIGGIEHV